MKRAGDAAAGPAREECARKEAPLRRGALLTRRSTEAAFSLVELLIVVAIIGVLSAMALPRMVVARRAAVEKAVTLNLKSMATNQQLFYSDPVPLRPSSLTDRTPRFARLNELNSFSRNVYGRTVSTYYVDTPGVRYVMVPTNPSISSLRGRFVIQVTEQNVTGGFIYQVDESARVVKIR